MPPKGSTSAIRVHGVRKAKPPPPSDTESDAGPASPEVVAVTTTRRGRPRVAEDIQPGILKKTKPAAVRKTSTNVNTTTARFSFPEDDSAAPPAPSRVSRFMIDDPESTSSDDEDDVSSEGDERFSAPVDSSDPWKTVENARRQFVSGGTAIKSRVVAFTGAAVRKALVNIEEGLGDEIASGVKKSGIVESILDDDKRPDPISYGNIMNLYDSIGTRAFSSSSKPSTLAMDAETFFRETILTEEDDMKTGFDARGVVFSSPFYEDFRKREKADLMRIYTGPRLKEGLVKCNACIKKGGKGIVTSFGKQTKGADEPMTYFHRCTECNKQWRTEG